MTSDRVTDAFSRFRPLLRRADLLLLALLVLGTLGFRVWFVATQPAPIPAYDEAGYDASARRLLETGTFAFPRYLFNEGDGRLPEAQYRRFLDTQRPDAWTAPGYPAFLAGVYALSGTGPGRLLWAREAQALVSVITLLLAYAIGRRLAGRWAGVFSAGLLAFYLPFSWSTSRLMTETLYPCVLLGSLLVALVALERRTWPWFLATGLAAGVAASVRPIGLLWPAAVVVAVLVSSRVRLRETAKAAACIALGLMVLLVPWWVRNDAVYGRFVPLTTSSANAFVSATSPRYESGGNPSAPYRPDVQYDDLKLNEYWEGLAAQRLAERLRDRPLWLVGFRLSRTWESMGLWWPEDPPLIAKRPRVHAIEGYWHWVLWILFPLGVVAAIMRRDRAALLAASLTLYILLAHAATMVLGRYLQPAMAVNALVGGYALAVLPGVVRKRRSAEAGMGSPDGLPEADAPDAQRRLDKIG